MQASPAPLMRRETAPLSPTEELLNGAWTDFVEGMFVEILIMILVVACFLLHSQAMLQKKAGPKAHTVGGKRQISPAAASKQSKLLSFEKDPEAARVQKFVVSLLQKSGTRKPSSVLEQYEELSESCGAKLRNHITDDQNARSMYLALISSAVSKASFDATPAAAWSWTSQLVADMKSFGFTRNADFYGAALKIFGNAQFSQEGIWLYDAMLEDGVAPGNGMLTYILNMAVTCGEYSKALSVFDRIAAVSQPTPRTVMTVLRAHAFKKDWQGAIRCLDHVASIGCPPDNLILNSVLGLCVSCYETDGAELLLKRYKDVTDVVSCNIIIKGCAQQPDLRRAESILAGMVAHGPAPNIISYNTVMDCAVRTMRTLSTGKPSQGANWTDDAEAKPLTAVARRPWQLIDQLIAQGLEPDRYTCSTLVKGMHLAGCTVADIDKAVALLNHIGPEALQVSTVGAPVPESCNERLLEVLFNTLLDACISSHDLERMVKIFSLMQQFGVAGSAVTYGTLIKAFGQSGHLNRCHETWKDMWRNQIQPTIVTYGCYIDACVRNEQNERAEEIFESMRTTSRGVRPNAVIYTSLIRGFAQAKQPKKALQLYRRMRDEGIEATSVTFNSILDIVARQLSEPAVLQEVVNDMVKSNIMPDVATYSILMKASCSAGNIQNALSLFRQFQSKGFSCDPVAFNTLLLACSKAEQVADAEAVFEEMCRLGMTPTHVTTSIMVKMYGKARLLDKAIGVSEILERDYGQKPNLYVYTCLIQACTQNKQVRRSWEIFNKMVSAGVEPDAITYGTVIHGCVYLNKFSYAMALVRHAYKRPSPSSVDVDTPFLSLPVLKQMVPLQHDVLQMLLAALKRKEHSALAAELDEISATSAHADAGKSQSYSRGRGRNGNSWTNEA